MKLIHKTGQFYSLLSLAILLLTIPIFYVMVNRLWIDDVDESLWAQKEKITNALHDHPEMIDELSATLKFVDLAITLNPIPEDSLFVDDLYTALWWDHEHQEDEPFRVLDTRITANGGTYHLRVMHDLVENEDLVMGIFLVEVGVMLVFLLMFLVLNNYLSKRMWMPFFQLIDTLRKFRVDRSVSLKFAPVEIDEFNALGGAIEHLTNENHKIFQSQKAFTENASHELQTPLAVMKNQLELLMQTKDLNPEAYPYIEIMEMNLRYMSKLSKNLLWLSKIENGQFEQKTKLNLTDLIKGQCRFFEEQLSLQGIDLQMELQQEVEIEAVATLWQSLVLNFLTNAIKYNVANGFIKIVLNGKSFQVINTGGFQPLDGQKIRERFYKGQQQSAKSSGLGLSIVHEICQRMEYDFSYQYQKPNIHLFKIYF